MRAERQPDLATFTARAGALLAGDPVVQTVICSTVELAATQPERYADAAWMTVTDGAAVVGAAIQTPPYPVTITPMPDPAVDALVELVAAELPDTPGLSGPRPHADRFAARWAARTGARARESRAMRVFRLDEVTAAPAAPGELRNGADLPETYRELFGAWVRGLVLAIEGEPAREPDELVDRLLARRGLWVWCDGEPVSFASLSMPAYGVARVGLVWTPPELRGRGYASNCVAALSRHALAGGLTPVLFTDLANPTSNKIYQQIGYRPVTDAVEFSFTPARGSAPDPEVGGAVRHA